MVDNPEYEAIRTGLFARLGQWYYEYADPAVDGTREAATGFGQMCRPGIYAAGAKTYADSPKYQK